MTKKEVFFLSFDFCHSPNSALHPEECYPLTRAEAKKESPLQSMPAHESLL